MFLWTSSNISFTKLMKIEEYEVKLEAAFAVLCPNCNHRWGNHAIIGCIHHDCYSQGNGCKQDGIRAIRNMMNDPNFKFTYIPKPKDKMEVQTTL